MDKKSKIRLIILISVLLLSLLARMPLETKKLPYIAHRLNNSQNTDIHAYLFMAHNFATLNLFNDSGWDDNNSYIPNLEYKFPPLYSIFLIPIFLFKISALTYIASLNEFLATLTIIPLFFLLKKIISFRNSITIATLSTFTFLYTANDIMIIETVAILFTFIFAIFIYFFYDIDNNKNLFSSSLMFGLLIFTHYVAFYLFPFTLLWMYKRKIKIRNIIYFYAISLLPISAWWLRNAIVHGFSLIGIFGGYTGWFRNFFIYPSVIKAKLLSIFHLTYTPLISTFLIFLAFLVTLLLLIYTPQSINQKLSSFYKVMVINLIFFIILTGFTYRQTFFNYRFLLILSPLYFAIGAAVPLRIKEDEVKR